ncbi:MAG: hypothetical protein JWS10_2741 [Cypionkella sp.]|nr:hypothetical protein [Cypionkella sp.]
MVSHGQFHAERNVRSGDDDHEAAQKKVFERTAKRGCGGRADTLASLRVFGAYAPAAITALMCRMSDPQHPPMTRRAGNRWAIPA